MNAEFDNFLFAQVGEDRNGMPLTVVSLLARMNLDPWQEAKSLAALSADAATQRLAFCLGGLTEPTLVRRLLSLLPSRATTPAEEPVAATPATTPARQALRLRTLFFIAAAIVLVGSQLLSRHRLAPSPAAATASQPAVTR